MEGVLFCLLGLVCLIARKDFFGLILGAHFLVTGVLVAIVKAGSSWGGMKDAESAGLIVLLLGVILEVIGLALAWRSYFIHQEASTDGLSKLKG